MMALSSPMAELRTRLYVIGEQAATMSSWTSTDMDDLNGVGADDPELLFDDALRAVGGSNSGYARVFSGDYGDAWVTRFETLAAPAAHTTDPVLTLDGGTDRTDLWITIEDAIEATWLFWPLALLGFGAHRRRRQLLADAQIRAQHHPHS
jgi:MYXO-CTERM domain-containing protein